MKQGTTVQRLFYFPVKGCAGTELPRAELREGCGIPFDRAFAFRYRADGSAANYAALAEFPWATKSTFAVQHDWPGLARLQCSFSDSSAVLRLSDRSGQPSVSAPVDTEAGRARLGSFATEFLSQLEPSRPSRRRVACPLELVGSSAGSTRYPDRNKMHVSILNLASLRELEEALGAPQLDIRRFRGNIIVDGLPAWGELGWEGGKFRIGSGGDAAEIEILGPIHRCHNVNVEPETGDDQVRAFEVLKERFGHTKFGVAAVVTKPGAVSVRDSVTLA